MIGRHQSELPTPALCVDLDRLEQNIAKAGELLRAAGLAWVADVSWGMCPELADRLVAAGAAKLAIATVEQAEAVGRTQARGIVITHPVVGAESLRRVSRLADETPVTLTIDHFAQAQAAAQVLRERGTTCGVRVVVNVGGDRLGVRAGWDALDLCKGVATLPELKLTEIAGEFSFIPTDGEHIAALCRAASGLELLRELREQLTAIGRSVEVVGIGQPDLLAPGLAFSPEAEDAENAGGAPGVSSLQVGDELLGVRTPLERMADPSQLSRIGGLTGQMRAASHIVATVVSRPKLERAVLDVGSRQLGDDCKNVMVIATAHHRPLGKVTVRHIDQDCTTLELHDPAAFDLLIGDKVEVGFPRAAPVWLRHRRVHVLRSDCVEAVWGINEG